MAEIQNPLNNDLAHSPIFYEDPPIRESIANEYLSIEVTTECNSKCIHCFASAGRTKRSTLDIETVRSIMKEGYELGYKTIHFTGGEPLLWPHLTQILNEAFEIGYPAAFINTNGTLLSKEKCAEFARHGEKLRFSLSLHGPEELHESIRGKGSYKKTTEGLKNALDHGLKINIFTSVGKSLLERLPEFVTMVFSEFSGIEYMAMIQLIRVHQDSYDLSDELLDPKDFIQFVQTVSMLSLYGLNVRIIENDLSNVLTDLLNIRWLPPEPSISRPGRAVIMADGNITVYHSSRETFGLYKPGSLLETVQSDAYRKEVEINCTGCIGCPHTILCERNRIRRPSEWFRDMHPEVPFCRRVLDEASKE